MAITRLIEVVESTFRWFVLTIRCPRNAKFVRCSVSMFLDLNSRLNVIVFATMIEHDVEKSFLTSARVLFDAWESILNPQTLRELLLLVGGNFYIKRVHFWMPRDHFKNPKGRFGTPKGNFWTSVRSLFDYQSRF